MYKIPVVFFFPLKHAQLTLKRRIYFIKINKTGIVVVEKQVLLHILSVCLSLFIQHAKRMRHFMLSSVACLAVSYFFTLSQKQHDFGKKKVILRKICVLIFSTTFVWTIFHSKNNSAKY